MKVIFSIRSTVQMLAAVARIVNLQAGQAGATFAPADKAHFFEPGVTGMNLSRTNELAHALI